jgi:hypothetical protein
MEPPETHYAHSGDGGSSSSSAGTPVTAIEAYRSTSEREIPVANKLDVPAINKSSPGEATKISICRVFVSRRADSNRGPLHYEGSPAVERASRSVRLSDAFPC